MMAELFQFFLDHTDRLPDPYGDMARTEPAHRVVCDYIAGMTDSFFHRTYVQMIGPYSSTAVKFDTSAERTP
jgi:dGTPase